MSFFLVAALYAAGTAWFARIPQEAANADNCAVDQSQGLGCVHGVVVDENGKAVGGVKVDLIPTFKTGDAQWYATLHVWTDKMGRYNFNRVEVGEYLVAVHRDDAPDAEYPFATSFYPGVEAEQDAGHLAIKASSETVLGAFRLKRLEVATIAITVIWEDGTRPMRSNLLFHNPSYPQQGVIGDVAPEVHDGSGQFSVPKGFEYYARAKVDCEAGSVIETRESRPVQLVKIADGFTPKELIFVLPGPPCKLWAPRGQ